MSDSARRARRAGALGAVVLVVAVSGCGGSDEPVAPPVQEAAATTTEEMSVEETTVEGATPNPDPQSLVPQVTDLPAGYGVDGASTGPTSLTDALRGATDEEAALIEDEWVSGYEIAFVSANRPAIVCRATVHRSITGAADLYRLGNDVAPGKARDDGGTAERVSIDESLGEETAAFSTQDGGISGFVVRWRDRNLIGLCLSADPVAADSVETVRVGRAQQARFATALG